MARPIVAAKIRRIKPRCYASIEKEGVAAAEAIAEKTGKIRVHPSLGNDDMHLLRARYANAVPRLAVVPIHEMKGD